MFHNTATLNGEINPFNIQWLSENFSLNPSEVVKAGFNPLSLNIIYQITFTSKEASTKFYENIRIKNIPCAIYNNKVEINKHSREKIIKAAGLFATMNNSKQDVGVEFKTTSSFSNSNITISPSMIEKSLLRVSKEKSILELTLEKIIPNPFNLDWLSKYLGLNKQHVNKSNFNFDFLHYSITFDTLENAQNFYLVLKQAGASLQIWEYSNTLEIAYSNQFKILRFVGQSDTGLNPWNIDFFATYFDLNKDQVKADEHSAFYYTLKFHNPHDAYNYYKKLLKNSIYPKEPYSDGDLVLTNMNCEVLLKKAVEHIKNQGLSFS